MPFLNKSAIVYPEGNILPSGVWEDTRNPTSTDFKIFSIGDTWINFAALTAWIMVDRTGSSGTWVQMGAAGTGILTITGDAGGAVGPDGANNINILTGAGLTITGNAGTNTLTATLDAVVATSYVADAGSAVPAANVLNIVGAGGVTTSAAGSTVTITAGVTVPTTFTSDAGVATPILNNLNILGGTLIATTGAADTITISATGLIASTYTCDVGSATPAANNLNVVGAGATATSGAGSTITISSTGGGIMWSEITVIGPTQMIINNGYVTNNGSPVQLLLPLTAVFGSILRIVGKGAGGWLITQNAGQTIVLEGSTTTAGVTGTLGSSTSKDTVELLCTTADTVWTIIDGNGNYIFT